MKKEKQIRKHKSFFRKMLDPTDHENSSKRFVTLIVSFHFILASFFILYLMWTIMYKETRTNLELFKVVSDTLKDVLEYDFYIIISGLGFITAEQFGKAMIEKAKAKATGYGDVITGDDTTVIQGKEKTTEPPVEELPQ